MYLLDFHGVLLSIVEPLPAIELNPSIARLNDAVKKTSRATPTKNMVISVPQSFSIARTVVVNGVFIFGSLVGGWRLCIT